jgi:hypothetical protein
MQKAHSIWFVMFGDGGDLDESDGLEKYEPAWPIM